MPEASFVERFELSATDGSTQDGVQGKAWVAGVEPDGHLRNHPLPAKALTWSKGALAFWTNPVDWAGDDTLFHDFICAKGKNALLRVYKYKDTKELFFLLGPTEKAEEQH